MNTGHCPKPPFPVSFQLKSYVRNRVETDTDKIKPFFLLSTPLGIEG